MHTDAEYAAMQPPGVGWSRREVAVLAIILLIAAVVRMGWPGLTEFKADEARLYSLALAMSDGQFALRGISSSVGFPNFPMSVWLYSLPLFVWPHPYAATIFTGLLNTLAVAVTYWLARRTWGVSAALVAALMFAVSPWAVIYSRKIWAQNLLPLFVVGWGAAASLALVERRRPFIALHVLCLAVAVQLHLAAAALVPASLLLLGVFRRRIDWRWLAVGLVVALSTAAPFLIYLFGRDPLATLVALPGGSGGDGVRLSLDSLRYGLMVTIGSDIHSLAGPAAFRDYLALVPGMGVVRWLWAGLVAAAVVWMIVLIRRNHHDPRAETGLIWLVWLAAPVLAFAWEWTEVYPHYLIATFPAAYLLAGAAMGEWFRQSSLRTRGGWALGLTATAQLYAVVALLLFLGGRATPGGFGTPLAMKLRAAERATALVGSGAAAEVIIAGRGDSPAQDEFPAEYDALLAGVPRRFADLDGTALFPAAAAVVLADAGLTGPEAGMADVYREAAESVEAVVLREGEGELLVMVVPPAAAAAPDRPLDPPPLLANWVRLLGTSGPDDPHGDGRLLWKVHWRTADNPDPSDYHFFNHLLDGTGARVAQVDAPAFDGDQWRAGDVVVSQFVFYPPPAAQGPLLMRVGMYRYPDMSPALLLDEAANPYADALEVPLALGD